MTTATTARHKPTWADVLPEYLPGETIADTIARFVGDDPDRLLALVRKVKSLVEEDQLLDEWTNATLIAGKDGPIAAIAETFTQHGRHYLRGVLNQLEKDLRDDDDADADEDTPAPEAREEEAADDDQQEDDDTPADNERRPERLTDEAIPEIRSIVTALQTIDGLPLWRDVKPIRDAEAGYPALRTVLAWTLNHSVRVIADRLPIDEQAKLLDEVTKQAAPYLGKQFAIEHDEKPVNTAAAVEILKRIGPDVEKLIDAFARPELRFEVEDGIGCAIWAMTEALPIEAQARVFKLAHARSVAYWEAHGKAGQSA